MENQKTTASQRTEIADRNWLFGRENFELNQKLNEILWMYRHGNLRSLRSQKLFLVLSASHLHGNPNSELEMDMCPCNQSNREKTVQTNVNTTPYSTVQI